MEVKSLFGANLKFYRKQCGLSQEQLAEKAKVSAKHIGALETGISFVSAELLQSFSEILNVPVSDFFIVSPEEKTDRQKDSGLIEEINKIVSKKMDEAISVIVNETRKTIMYR